MKMLKYPLDLDKFQFSMMLPKGAEICSVEVRKSQTCLWAFVDPNAEPEIRYFELTATGYSIPDERAHELVFLRTFFIHNDDLVFHLFESKVPNTTKGDE